MGKRFMVFVLITAMLSTMFIFEAPQKAAAAGITYYVDAVNGNDTTGNGSTGSPWKTIGKAASVMTAGDTAKIRSGVYRETVKPVNSGTSGNDITFQPDTGADVTVSGADLVSGTWTAASGVPAANVFKINTSLNMGDYLDQVYVDGVSNNLARSPNSDVNNLYNPALYEYDNTKSSRSNLVDATNLNQAAGNWDNAAIFAEDSGSWNFSSAIVTSSTPGNLNLLNSQTYYAVRLSSYDNTLKLIDQNGTLLGSSAVTVALNTVYNLKVAAVDSSINVYLNNGATPVITATDAHPSEGFFGLGVQSNSSTVAATAQFTNVNANITAQSLNQITGEETATFASNLKGWSYPEATGYWTTDGTTASGYTQPQTAGTTASYESAAKAKNFTYSADVKLTSAGMADLTFRKQDVPYHIGLANWNLGNSEYFIMGKLSALDYPGEWFYDKTAGSLYLKTTASDNPSLHTVEVKARNLAFDLTGKSHIVVKGVKLFASTIDMANGSNIVVDGINAKYVSQYNIQFAGSSGICLCGTSNTLKNSEVAFSSGALVTVKGTSNKLINNRIHDGTYGGIVFNSAVDITGIGHLISHNTVYNSGRSLIGGEFFAADISYNDFYGSNSFATDTGLLYTAHNDLGNSEIHHNYWHDSDHRLLGKNGNGDWTGGIYLDESSANALIYNNVTWNIPWMGTIVNHLSDFVMVYNNTYYNKSTIEISEPGYGIDAYKDKIINNIAVDGMKTGATTIGAAFNNNMTTGDPLYVNTANKDFHLQSGSPAINAGIAIRGITDGAVGVPDIGAYEYGGTNWTAGADLNNPPNPEPTYRLIATDYKNLIVNGSLDLNRMHHPTMDSLYGWTKTNSLTAQPAYDYTGGTVSSRFHYETGVSLGTGIDGIEQTITGLAPSTTYEISGYLRPNTAGQTIRLGVKNYGGTDTYQENTTTAWVNKTFTFTTGAASTSATIYAYKPTTGGYAFVDDIMVSSTTAIGGPTPTPTPAANLALNKSVTVSSIYGAGYEGSKAVDGNASTRWAAAAGEGASTPQWVNVDLGATMSINEVKLNWDASYSTSYKIQVSSDAAAWTDVYSTTTGNGGLKDITFTATNARYVRMYSTARIDATYGVSIYEFEVYGPVVANLALNKNVTVSSIYSAGYEGSLAVDGNPATRWSSAPSDPQWIYVDLGATYSISHVKLNWDPAYATSYQLQVSTDATNWTNVYSTATGVGAIDDITFSAASARYVRMYGIARATVYGYSLWEFEVYN